MKTILVGKGGSGKDTLRKRFEARGYKSAVFHTTRPPRDGEENGVDYHFVNPEEFEHVACWYRVKYGPWWYGLSATEWSRCHVAIFTPVYLQMLDPMLRASCFVMYLDIDEATRRERLKSRFDADNVERRIQSDEEQFAGFVDFDMRITNPYF